MKRCVRRGYVLSQTFLFLTHILSLYYIGYEKPRRMPGSMSRGSTFSKKDLRYADGIIYIAENKEDLQRLLDI